MSAKPSESTDERVRPPGIGGYSHGRVPRQLREQQMLDVAEAAFTELGYAATSIEEVCRRAQLKRPIFYTYFGGKDGLYLACHARARAELNRRLAEAAVQQLTPEPTSGLEDLRGIVSAVSRAYFDFLEASPSSWELLYGPGAASSGPVAETVSVHRRQSIEVLAELIRPFAPTDTSEFDLVGYAHATSGACEQLARWWRDTDGLVLAEVAELATRFIWAALSERLVNGDEHN